MAKKMRKVNEEVFALQNKIFRNKGGKAFEDSYIDQYIKHETNMRLHEMKKNQVPKVKIESRFLSPHQKFRKIPNEKINTYTEKVAKHKVKIKFKKQKEPMKLP